MRSIYLKCLLALLGAHLASVAYADPGTPPQRVSRDDALAEGRGAVVISIRSELYLDEPLDVFFLREGGEVTDDSSVFAFRRRQGALAFGNDTLGYQVRVFALPVGTYRLVAHGMNCPKVPAEDERCLVERRGLNGTQEVSRPSRGYGAIAPTFEVRPDALTYAGDYVLTARNTIEWSQIPYEKLDKVRRRFADLEAGPAPVIPGEYRLRYGLNARSYNDDAGRRY